MQGQVQEWLDPLASIPRNQRWRTHHSAVGISVGCLGIVLRAVKGLCSNHWESVLGRGWLADSRRRASVGSILRLMTMKFGEGPQGQAHGANSVKASRNSFEACVARLVHRWKGYLGKLLADIG